MSTRFRGLPILLAVAVVFASHAFVSMDSTSSHQGFGNIDLYTQKEPYSGKGRNKPSDAFGPDEAVFLHALVTYNENPIQGLPVAFFLTSPGNETLSLAAETDLNGIAVVDFTTPKPQQGINESGIFGVWTASSNVKVDSETIEDTLAFKVDYIVRLVSVRTIDENGTFRVSFGLGGDVGLEIGLRNIAMTFKRATVAVVIQDAVGVPVSYFEVPDFAVQPNGKLVLAYCKLRIPNWAYVGNASITVSAFVASAEQGSVPYCPSISTDVFINPYGPFSIAFHDASVLDVVPSALSIDLGSPFGVSVQVANHGTEAESFNVSARIGDVLNETTENVMLPPYSDAALNFTFETSLLPAGNYTLIATIPILENEIDKADNFFVYGTIEVRPEAVPVVHDVAVINVETSGSTVFIGDLPTINVTVANKGDLAETFNVSAYYGSNLIQTIMVNLLASRAQTTFAVVWNTSSAQEGYYQISASAPLPNDSIILDNTFVDGIVQVKAKPSQPMLHDVAILGVSSSSSLAHVGDTVNITVTVQNQGNYTESFNVTAYYDENEVGTLLIEDLSPTDTEPVMFHWNTHNVLKGNYTLKAMVSGISEEANLTNNFFVDGRIQIAAPPAGTFILSWPDWFLMLLLLLVLFLVSLLAAWLYLRKRKKNREKFHSGWTAWYYGHGLRNTSGKI